MPKVYPEPEKTNLVLLTDWVSDLVVEMPYASETNPFGRRFYRAELPYIRYGTALKIARVQRAFVEHGLRLKVWDTYRPFPVQVAMFHAVGGNGDWVSDPYQSSGKKTHVRGVAIDCTLVDRQGAELAMPTPYVDFKNGAERMKHSYSDLPREVLDNRRMLRETMIACGLEPYEGEWWHYQDVDWADYPILKASDVPEIHRALLVADLLEGKL